MGWLPNAQMIADGMPDAPKAKPPALMRRPATEFKGECFDARDMEHPAAKPVSAPVVTRTPGIIEAAVRHVVSQTPSRLQWLTDALREQEEAAKPEWIEWGGGRCPIPGCLRWEVRFSGGLDAVIEEDAAKFFWDRRGVPHDFVAYRVLPEPSAPKANAEGWIEWGGGECSVEARVNVLVRYRGGDYEDVPRPANAYRWRHGHETDDGWDEEYDIVAYRVLP
jgi:hypothetical protein